MACNQVAEVRIEPCDVTWEIEEKWEITCVADVASSLNDTYFLIYDGANAGYYVWFDVAGAGTDPALAGKTGISVAIAANASAATVATAVQTAIDGNANFEATVSGATVEAWAVVAGQSTDWSDSAGLTATGFSFTQCQDGGSLDLGLIDGDIEVTFEEQVLDVTAHQFGTTVLASLRQGLVNEVTLTMKEADYAKYKELMLGTAGAAYTPSGGTEVFGWGTKALGSNTIIKSRRLVLHPVAQGASKARDLCFWKAYALPDTLTISGENPKTLSLTFKIYRDDTKEESVNQFIFGDWDQAEFVP